jgi:hypothetical protein
MSEHNDDEQRKLEEELRGPLSGWNVRPVHYAETAKLIQALQPEFDAMKQQTDLAAGLASSAHSGDAQPIRPSILRLIAAQLSSYSRSYWAASIAVFGMLVLMLSTFQPPYDNLAEAFTLFAPAVLLAGLLYSFRSWNKGMRTIESVTPYPPALLLLCRFLIVIALNVALSLAASLYLAVSMTAFPLLPFLLQWLSLMLLIGGLLANLILYSGIRAGMVGGIIVWLAWNGSTLTGHASWTANAEWAGSVYLAGLLAGAGLLLLAYRKSLGIRIVKQP